MGVLRIIHLEDSPEDAELARSLLKSEGIDCRISVARNRDEFIAALGEKEFDLIVSDYALPSFDGMSALKITREKTPETPFIFLSGVMGEDAAIESLLSGATDYVLKQKIARFIPAVRRAIHDLEAQKKRKAAEEAAKKSLEIRSEFTAMVSHELRTPLTVIKEGVDIVLDGTDGALNEEQKKHLQLAIKNVDRMVRLINNVLNYQKLESGNMEFRMRSHDLNEFVRDVIDGFEPVFKKKGLELESDLARGLPMVWCDRDRVTEVLVNFLNNALKFTESGRVRVSTSQDEQWVHVRVQDDGIGIREEDKPRLFQSFSQLGNEGKNMGGTGLGLAISKKIIERHRGQIQVDSHYKKGSTFCFSLPIQNMSTNGIARKILIADDEADIIDLISDRLNRAGYQVVVAANGQEALKQLDRCLPALVILDYKMPLLDGHEVCKRIRADERFKKTPVIFLTASPQAATPELMQSIGADDYLIKPFEVVDLFEKVSRFLL